MTNEEVDRLLSTAIPGGSQARDWFLPHDTKRGLENVRDVVRRLVAGERESCAGLCDGKLKSLYLTQGRPAHEEALLVAAVDDCASAIRAR